MRRSGLWKLAAAAACVLGALFAVAALSPTNTAGPCVVTQDPVMLRDVPEASGLAVSRRRPGLIWTHNDSGNESDLFALDASGTVLATVRMPIRTRDWEDISAAPCPSGECLYIADIGDNELARKAVQVYRLPEPDPWAGRTVRPLLFNVTYPDGAHNAEAMFVAGGRIFIVTRDRVGALYGSTTALDDVVSGLSRTNPNITLERIGQLGLAAVTDAEASADEASVAVRTSHEVVVYRTAEIVGAPDQARPTSRIPIDGLREPQGEAVALGDNGMIYLASEGRPWSRAGRFISLQCGKGRPEGRPLP
jgi:hypothetical protein